MWAVASLLHLPKRRLGEALNELRRILRPGGGMFCTVKRGTGERFFSFYEPKEFEAALEAAGFALQETRAARGRQGDLDLPPSSGQGDEPRSGAVPAVF